MRPHGDRWSLRLPALRRLRRSLGMRLLALFLLLALATSAIFLFGMQRAPSGGWSELLRPLVADYVDRLAAEIGTPPDVARAQALVARLPLAIRIDGPVVQFDSHPGRPTWRARAASAPDEAPPAAESGTGTSPGINTATHDGAWLLTRHTADGHRIRFGLGDFGWQRQPRNIGGLTLAALLLLTMAAYAYVRRLFRPLDDIRAGALRYGRGDFAQPIPLRRPDELGDLARQVNTMASELHRMLDAKRALLLAISHELRSPLTRARLNAELLGEDGEGGDPHREALLRDLGEMRDLITGLLESERLAGGHAALHCEPTDLGELLRESLAESFSSAGLLPRIDADLPRLQIDRTRMRLLLRNLIDNALRHSPDADRPPELSLKLAASGDALLLSVRDFGPGVAPEHLPHLAEPFYRADAARQRATGGVGLGLTLCSLVAQAHGGSLTLRNAGPGFEAGLRLPLVSG